MRTGTLGDWSHVEGHLEHLSHRNLRPSSIKKRRQVFQRLGEFIAPTTLLGATPPALIEYLDRPLGVRARASEISDLRGFYGWAMQEELISVDPTTRLVRPRLPRLMPRPIPTDDLARALAEAPPRIKPMLYLAAYAGLRACEIAGLAGEDVLLNTDPPIIMVAEGKGGGMSSVPIATVLTEVLATGPRSGWLFPHGTMPGRPIPPHRVSQLCNRYLHEIGITATLHQLRHWFGTNSYQLTGRDIRATQELMRHQSIASTAIYTWVDPRGLADAVEGLPRL